MSKIIAFFKRIKNYLVEFYSYDVTFSKQLVFMVVVFAIFLGVIMLFKLSGYLLPILGTIMVVMGGFTIYRRLSIKSKAKDTTVALIIFSTAMIAMGIYLFFVQ